jgi:GNAT superfamily N-acetyltransferase
MTEISVRLEDELSAQDRETVIDGLVAYNAEQGFVWDRQPVQVVARADDGRVVGGLLGDMNLGWLFVSALWVERASRRSGIGARLLREAEARARERGCVGIYLDTYSFQARPFYERLGFRLFGELPDCPPGGAKYYLHKRFDRDAG